jgi:hypothetical protein
MARYAQVHTKTGYVVNVIEWDGNVKTWKPPEGFTMVEDKRGVAGPGHLHTKGKFTPPPGGGEPDEAEQDDAAT